MFFILNHFLCFLFYTMDLRYTLYNVLLKENKPNKIENAKKKELKIKFMFMILFSKGNKSD